MPAISAVARVSAQFTRSTMVAMPWPTPMHMVARPYRLPRFCISCTKVVIMRAPLQPRG